MTDAQPSHPRQGNWAPAAGLWDISETSLKSQPVGPDGRPTHLGHCEIRYPLPGGGCWQFRFGCNVVSDAPHDLAMVVDNAWFVLGTNKNSESMLCVDGQAEAYAPLSAKVGQPQRIEVRSDGPDVVFTVDGEEAFRHQPRRRPFARLGLLTWSANTYMDLQMDLVEFVGSTGHRPRPAFRLSCAVDFLDDARRCKWTPDMIGQYIQRLKELGVTRVYWEDYARLMREDFRTDPEVYALAKQDLQREPPGVWDTFGQPMDDFAVATEQAHAAGLEMYALIKPFDWHYYDPQNEKGNYYPSHQFLFANQDKMMQRRPRPAGTAPDAAPIRTIRLVSADARAFAFDHQDVELWLSHNNLVYERYTRPRQVVESLEDRAFADWWTQQAEPPQRVRVLTMTVANVTAPHLALRCRRSRGTLRNRLCRLVEVEATNGKPLEVTFAIDFSGNPPADGPATIRFDWDRNRGIPSAGLSGRDVIERHVAIDRCGWLGITRGGLRRPRRDWVTLCPAYPEVREWFMTPVRHALECGADGVDLRPGAHQRCHTWALRNFNPTMVDAYRARYVVDPSTEPYDRARFCQLAGEFYDLFVEEASLACGNQGRAIQHHVFREFDVTPRERGMMNIHFDWRKWIERGWVDAITLKNVPPGTPFFHEVMRVAAEAGVQAHACPFLNSVMRSTWRGEPGVDYSTWKPVVTHDVAGARREGCDGFILYEGAAFVRGTAEGAVEHIFPDAGDVIRNAAR